MAVINMRDKFIECKLVYYGPGRGGKTTNLEFIRRVGKKYTTSDMVSIKTKGDSLKKCLLLTLKRLQKELAN